jgi:hypothetical protein
VKLATAHRQFRELAVEIRFAKMLRAERLIADGKKLDYGGVAALFAFKVHLGAAGEVGSGNECREESSEEVGEYGV